MPTELIILRQLEKYWEKLNSGELDLTIPFGHIAFIKEHYWKNHVDYAKSSEKKNSHPGLSISKDGHKIAFGTSKTNNRDPKTTISVTKDDCKIINKKMVFLTKMWIPADITMIDDSMTGYAPVSEKIMKELENAGY